MGTFELARAPIAPGSERGARFLEGGSIQVPNAIDLSDKTTFLIDVQPELKGTHPLIRIQGKFGALSITLSRQSLAYFSAQIAVERDSLVRTGSIELSSTSGKRLAFRLDLANDVVVADEYQPWGADSGFQARTQLVRAGVIDKSNDAPLIIAGASGLYSGGAYGGRIAEFGIFDRLLPDNSIERLRASSKPERPHGLPKFSPGALDDEGREILLDDYSQLVRWHNQGHLSTAELRNASVITHMWLLDGYPLLQRASDHFGAMLSLPDLIGEEEIPSDFHADEPVLWSPDHAHEGDWVDRKTFIDAPAGVLGVTGYEISWTAFIKFVRNKLGGGHYDPDDRQRWQRDLRGLAVQAKVGGDDWLAAKMLTLVRSVIVAADGCGLVNLAREIR
jgi:hypothetical protein